MVTISSRTGRIVDQVAMVRARTVKLKALSRRIAGRADEMIRASRDLTGRVEAVHRDAAARRMRQRGS